MSDGLSPKALRELLGTDTEFALLDVRERGEFSEAHLLHAVCTPLSHLELLIDELVPRLATPLVVIDAGGDDDRANRAQARLEASGYTNVKTLDGGNAQWGREGFELFSGVNVPSKAFGEFVEQRYATPHISAADLKELLDRGANVAVVDSRPLDEYRRMSIPTATNMPGAELVYRINDLAPDPDTLVVVNCAGRTRSIIGAQSLINAGIDNRVVALENGTMGWHLAGFELDRGREEEAAPPSAAGLERAGRAAARVAERFGVPFVDAATCTQWHREAETTTFFMDVRSPGEFASGHREGFRSAPGGQLVQATDEYVGVRNARIVLTDSAQPAAGANPVSVRAIMTASWLLQMGWQRVAVLEPRAGGVDLSADAPRPSRPPLPPAAMTPTTLLETLSDTQVIDLGTSTTHERGHIPGAMWCVRARLAMALTEIKDGTPVVLTSEDGHLARLALGDLPPGSGHAVAALDGGTAAWRAAGFPVATGLERCVGAVDDVWYKPYEHRAAQERFMRDYLTWEVALVEQIERDGTARFEVFAP